MKELPEMKELNGCIDQLESIRSKYLTEKELKVIATAFYTTKPGMIPDMKTFWKFARLITVWLLILYGFLFLLSQL